MNTSNDYGIEILKADTELVCAVKPAGLLSEGTGQKTMVSCLTEMLGGQIFPVHRLDRMTGGVMVFARTSAAAAELSAQIQRGEMKKVYLAAVLGMPEQPSGRYEDLLFFDRKKNHSYVVKKERKGVKYAALRYQVLDIRNGAALVLVHLETGRTHQIRVQFSSRGMPLMGDGSYGGGKGTPQLWSAAVQYRHPRSRSLELVSELPDKLGPWDDFSGYSDLDRICQFP